MTERRVAPNTRGWKIRTDTGFVPFDGIALMGKKNIFHITFDDGSTLGASAGHFFYTDDGREIAVAELNVGLTLLGIPNRTVVRIDEAGVEDVYDVINTSTHTYFAGGLLSHNCQFISSDPLLISTITLATLTEQVRQFSPVGMAGDMVFFKQLKASTTYIVGMDVATGAENDFTAITCWEFPSLDQVAEFRSNTSSSVAGYHMLKKLLRLVDKAGGMSYFSVENNGVGEAIIALLEADETPVDNAEFVSEEGQKRLGMTTTVKSKIKACLMFKELVERHGITIRSESLIKEMKSFVRKGGSYAAKPGGTDDMIMATLIVVRILESLSTYDQDAYDKMYTQAFQSQEEQWSDDTDAAFGIVLI